MEGAVPLEPGIAGDAPGGSKVIGYAGAGAGVYLVRGLTEKGRVGHHRVVLVDVERDETLDGGEGVERVEEEPVVLEGTPPGLDHRVGESDFHLSEDAAEMTGG